MANRFLLPGNESSDRKKGVDRDIPQEQPEQWKSNDVNAPRGRERVRDDARNENRN